MVKRTAVNPDTREEYEMELPATRVVKEALLDFGYPTSGIEIKDVAESLAGQFVLTDEEKNETGNIDAPVRRSVVCCAW